MCLQIGGSLVVRAVGLKMEFDDLELPELKHIPDGQEEIAICNHGRRRESPEKLSIQLFTDSMVMISSSDTLNENRNKTHSDVDSCSECDSTVFGQNNAFSYYDSPSEFDNDKTEGSIFSSPDDMSTKTIALDEESEYCVEIVSRFLRDIQQDIQQDFVASDARITSVAPQQSHNKPKHPSIRTTRRIKSCPEAARISTSSFGDVDMVHPLSRSAPQTNTERYRTKFRQSKGSTRYRVDDESIFYTAEMETITSDSAAGSLLTAVESMKFQGTDDNFQDSPSTGYHTSTTDSVDTHAFMTASSGTPRESSSKVAGFTQKADAPLDNTTVMVKSKRKLCRSCSLDGLKFNPACPLQQILMDHSNELIVE